MIQYSGKTKVTQSARISFFTGCYHNTADFDVVLCKLVQFC